MNNKSRRNTRGAILTIASLLGTGCVIHPLNPSPGRVVYTADHLVRLAKEARQKGDERASKDLYERAIDKHLEDTWYEHAGDVAQEMGDPKRACEYYEQAYQKFIKNGWQSRARGLSSKMAYTAQSMGDLELAIKAYQRADLPAAVAEVAEKAGLLKKAFDFYSIMNDNDKVREIGERLGYEYKRKGQYIMAMRAFEAAAKALPRKNDGIYLDAAKCAEHAGLFHKAEEFYNKCMQGYLDIMCERDRFVERAKRAVSTLFERGDLSQAIITAGVISREYQLKIQAYAHQVRKARK